MKTLLPYFKKITSLLILMLFMAFVQRSFGQTASATWQPATSGPATVTPTIVGTAITAGSLTTANVGAGVSNVNTHSTTFGIGGTSWSSNNAPGATTSEYIQFQVAPTTGNTFLINSLSFDIYTSENSGTDDMVIYYSTSSTFASNVNTLVSGYGFTASTTYASGPLSIAVASGTTLYFRVMFYSVSSTSKTLGIKSNLQVSGSTFGAASKLVFTTQPSNTASASAITPAITVAVEDAAGNIVASDTRSITLAIATNPGSGTLSGTATVAASAGVATFTGISIDKIGNGYTLKATGTLNVTSTAFNITIGAASKLVFSAQPVNTVAAASMPAVTVQVQDAGGNIVTSDTRNITLSIGTNPGGGTLSGTLTTAAVSGSATFSGLSINKTGNGYTLSASGGFTVASATFNITPGVASQLVFSTQPINTVAAVSITPSVVVQVQDANGNLVTSDTRSITISIGTNPGGGTLSGAVTTSAINGAATFSTLSINKTGNGYTLNATSGFTVASNTFNITPGSASKLVFSAQPTNTVSATSISPAVVVQVQDANSNIVTNDNRTIVMSISNNPNGGTLSGTLSVAAVNGVATFSNLSIDKAGAGYTIKATATLTVTSTGFNITAGAAAKLAFNVQPSNAVAGVAISPSITVQIQDASGNLVTTNNTTAVTLAIGSNPGSGTLSGTAIGTASGGTATFSGLSINKIGNGYTLGATSSPSLSGATSTTFNISSAPVALITITTVASPQPVDESFTSSVTINGQDAFGNNANGDVIDITITTGTITPSSITLVNGSFTVNNFIATTPGTQIIKATSHANNLIFATSNSFLVSDFASNASGDFYRSVASTDWSNLSTWQGSHDGSNWYNVIQILPSNTAASILIQSGNNVTINGTASSSNLAINGTINVNGTLSNFGTITGGSLTKLFINSGATYTHAVDGNTIPNAKWDVASTCYVSGIQSNAPGNLSQTFGNYTWDCGGQTDDVVAPLPSTIKGNLTMKNSNGHYITLPSTVTVSGNFIMNGGALGIVCNTTFFGTASQTGTLNIAGNFTMTGGTLEALAGSGVFGAGNATFNIIFNGTTTQTFTKSGGSITEANGGSIFGTSFGSNNFTINNHAIVDFGTSQLDGASNFTLSSGGTIITANVNGLTQSGTGSTGGTIIGTTASGSGAGTRNYNSSANYTYDGVAPQNTGVFTTTTTASTIANLTINNAAGVTLSQPLTVTGTLFLTNGVLTTTTNLFSLSSTAPQPVLAVSDYTNTSYVNGPIQRTGSSAFIFPVGKIGTGYVPISISATSNSSSQTFRAEYVHSSATALGVIATGSRLQRVSSCDYWNLNLYSSAGVQQSALPAGVTVNLTLNWNQNSACNAITDLSSLAIGHFSSPTWDEAVVSGIYNPPTGNATNGSITSVGVANFSPFALATTNGISNPLPITLDYFTATKQVGYNKLTWKVECTSSSSSFDVERSYDGISFKAINTVKVSSATDCATPFVYDDYSSNGSKVYYRIKMVDIDDNAKYSNIELISSDANAIELMNIQPNPVYGDANLKISASGVQNIELAIIGIDGKQMQHKTLQVQQGTNNVQLNTGALAKGVYFVKGIFANGQTNVIKFIKQ